MSHENPFGAVSLGLAEIFRGIAERAKGRATHSTGIEANGQLVVLPGNYPANEVFQPGKLYNSILRHANIKSIEPDDRRRDGRGASLRLLEKDHSTPHAWLHDFVMNTGPGFPAPTASSFLKFLGTWGPASPEKKAEIFAANPEIAERFYRTLRNPDSYRMLHYHTHVTFLWKSTDRDWFVRYRLHGIDAPVDGGFVPEAELVKGLDFAEAPESDTRSKTHLRDEFKQSVEAGTARYVLSAQFRPAEPISDNPDALNCSIPWDSAAFPYTNLALLTLGAIQALSELTFSPGNVHPSLPMIETDSPEHFASMGVVRRFVYERAAPLRLYQYEATEAPNNLPRFDPALPLPAEQQPSLAWIAQLGIHTIDDVVKLMGRDLPHAMPTNLSRCTPDKLSDRYFVERRLNGFNPGKLRREEKGKPWHWFTRYEAKAFPRHPDGLIADHVTARFIQDGDDLVLHSIAYEMGGKNTEVTPQAPEDEWEFAKKVFLSSEFTFQEIQSHLGRCHINMDQYAMAVFRNLTPGNPVRDLLAPHFEGLLNIDKRGDSLILGGTGFLPAASVLTADGVRTALRNELAELDYRWQPVADLEPAISSNHFGRAARAFWKLLGEYVDDKLGEESEKLKLYAPEIALMSKDLVEHTVADKDRMRVDPGDLNQFCTYILYHCTFYHSWVNGKQYEDGGDPELATIGMWSEHLTATNPADILRRKFRQIVLMWTLASVRVNPVMAYGPTKLKERLVAHRDDIEPGIPLDAIMMSINI